MSKNQREAVDWYYKVGYAKVSPKDGEKVTLGWITTQYNNQRPVTPAGQTQQS